MDYDPVKDRLGGFFWKSPARTKAFYRLLDTVFLRSWYVRRALRQRIEGMGDRPVRVLDAGTGFGQYAYWLVDTFPNVEVTAVDVKDDYLERAQAFMAQTPYAGRVAFEKADLTLPLEYADTFDLALSVDVMEHIEDDRAVFRNVLAALKPGGFLIVNTPSDQGGSGERYIDAASGWVRTTGAAPPLEAFAMINRDVGGTHQPISKVGRGRMAGLRGGTHPLWLEGCLADHAYHRGERQVQQAGGVEHRRLVVLHIL